VDSPADASFARLEAAREELAKAWLQGIIERTPLDEVAELPVAAIAREAPGLVGELLREASGAAPVDPAGPRGAQGRLADLGRVRTPAAATHRDLASLHTLLIGALQRELPERERFARAVERLAETFGSMQATLGESLGDGLAAAEGAGPTQGLGGISELHDWLRRLVGGYRRYGHPFALLSIDVEGLDRVNQAFGQQTATRMLDAVAATLEREIREADHAIRLGEDDFCILAPYQDASAVLPLAERLRGSVAGASGTGMPPVFLAVGIASCPQHGESAVQLLDAAQEAAYAAKAAGSGIAISNGTSAPPQDRPVQQP